MGDASVLDDDLHWYKDAVIYELHIKAFCDGDADGIGDFQGLLQKLDYLQDLGVTAIWLLPFYPSPLKDDGYDIADYYNINPSYGDIPQFRHFLKEAHHRNLKVITELVLNHTSDAHAWFQRARKAPKGSKERNYYVWSDDPTQFKDVRIIFQDFEKSNWTWRSNITGTVSFIISPISTMAIRRYRRKSSGSSTSGVRWVWMGSGWTLYLICLNGRAPMARTCPRRMPF
jgi:maltose alpha-D-glucosyltransferase/alpha-amylase